jgi:transposase
MKNSDATNQSLKQHLKLGAPKRQEQLIHGYRYVFDDYHYWDTEKRQTRHLRAYYGRYDKNGNFCKFQSYNKRVKEIENIRLNKNNQIKSTENETNQIIIDEKLTKLEVPRNVIEHKQVGATYLLEQISYKIGIYDDLKEIFPTSYLQILSLAFYSILESNSGFYRFNNWAKLYYHPTKQNIDSQRISELVSNISENQKLSYFKNQIKRRLEDEYLAYDTTSISSYSKQIKQTKFGHNKECKKLPQINLALIIGEKTSIPVYYRILPGNITDVSTINKLINDIKYLNIDNVILVMDRGFFSKQNIIDLNDNGYKFVIGAIKHHKFVSNSIQSVSDIICHTNNFCPGWDLYLCTKNTFITLDKKINNFNISNNKRIRLFMHIFYDPTRAMNEKKDFDNDLKIAISNLSQKSCNDYENNLINKFCFYDTVKDNIYELKYNDNAIREYISKFGYFVLSSNYVNNGIEALSIYRNKDIVEKAFHNLKDRLNLRTTGVHSDLNLSGTIFIQFIGLALLFYIHNKMKINNMYKNMTLDKLLDELRIITRYDYNDNQFHYSEITQKQKDIFKSLDIDFNSTFYTKIRN